VHLVYFQGDAAAGDIFYCRLTDSRGEFSEPIRVNSQPNSAIAVGTIRGAQLAVGKSGRVHVAWNGSGKATPKGLANPDLPEDSPYRLSTPMLYARGDARGGRFEPQRNLMTHTYALDGGGSVAADAQGNVYVVWHANSRKSMVRGESGRAVWVAASHDDGKTFASEKRANTADTGACGCCGLRAFVNQHGELFVLYRTAEETINRDMHVLVSKDQGTRFDSMVLDRWEVPTCVMSSASLLGLDGGTFAAWETERQVKFARVDNLKPLVRPLIFEPAARESSRKHPVLAGNSHGEIILVWTEGTGWKKGGVIAWQIFDRSGHPLPDASGRVEGVPVWSLAGVFARGDDSFVIVY